MIERVDSAEFASMDHPEVEFFEGLEWPVPRAFASALANSRFEQGDVLYDVRDAYAVQPPESGERKSWNAVQVLHPPRSARVVPGEADGGRRQANWDSEVVLDWIDLEGGETRRQESTQGRLLMMLWQGDPTWLDPDHEAPALPLVARELSTRLASLLPVFDARRKGKKKAWRFLFVVDLAADSARVKAESIREALASIGPIEVVDLRPSEAEMDEAERFHPLLVARSIEIGGLTAKAGEARIHAALRAVLYGGKQKTEAVLYGGKQKTEAVPEDVDEEAPDRFSLARHGLLVPPGGLPASEND